MAPDLEIIRRIRQKAEDQLFARAGVTEYLAIDPQDLREALARDTALLPEVPPPSGDRSRRVRDLLRLRSQRP